MATASFVTDLTELLTQGIEAAAGIAGVVNSFKLVELAQDYYDLYAHQREFYYNTFQQGVEAPLASEIYADPKPVKNYAERLRHMTDQATGPLGGESTDALGWAQRHSATYGSSVPEQLRGEIEVARQAIMSDWANYMFRFEETYYDVRMDIWWRKRLALHNLGMKEGTAISSSLGDALGQYQSHIQDFGNQLATYGNGVARYVGYRKGLADVADDFDQVEYTPRADLSMAYQLPGNMA